MNLSSVSHRNTLKSSYWNFQCNANLNSMPFLNVPNLCGGYFFLINRYHPYRWVMIISWLNCCRWSITLIHLTSHLPCCILGFHLQYAHIILFSLRVCYPGSSWSRITTVEFDFSGFIVAELCLLCYICRVLIIWVFLFRKKEYMYILTLLKFKVLSLKIKQSFLILIRLCGLFFFWPLFFPNFLILHNIQLFTLKNCIIKHNSYFSGTIIFESTPFFNIHIKIENSKITAYLELSFDYTHIPLSKTRHLTANNFWTLFIHKLLIYFLWEERKKRFCQINAIYFLGGNIFWLYINWLLQYCCWSLARRYITTMDAYNLTRLCTTNISGSCKRKWLCTKKDKKQLISLRNYDRHRICIWASSHKYSCPSWILTSYFLSFRVVFILIVIFTMLQLIYPLAFFRCFLLNLGAYTELWTTSFI